MSDTLDIEFESETASKITTASQYFEAYISKLEDWIKEETEDKEDKKRASFLNPSTEQKMIGFKERIENLKVNEESLRQIFENYKLDDEILRRNRFYPNSIKGYHTVRNSIILSAIACGLAYATLHMIGGPNPQLYSPLLYGVAWGSGITIGSGITAVPAIRGIKKFKKASKNSKEPEKLGLIERALMKSAEKKYFILAEINLDTLLKKMLQGNFVCREERTVQKKNFWGKEVPRTIQVDSDEFKCIKSLSLLTRKKLERAIIAINSTVEELQSVKKQLDKRKDEFDQESDNGKKTTNTEMEARAREEERKKMLAEKEAGIVLNENAKDNKPHSDAPPLVEQPLNSTPGSKPKVKAVRRHKPNSNSNSSNRR
jgi:hypothetical protein